MPSIVISYAGFLRAAGGAFCHARLLQLALLGKGWQADMLTLDRLPICVRYMPHLCLWFGNFVAPALSHWALHWKR
jgi:hypothetical protein